MTQHLSTFLLDCTTATSDGSLTTLDEFEGLYVYWCSLHDEEPLETQLVLAALEQDDIASVTRDGIDYVEGLLLTGPVLREFIVSCEFTGAWGSADLLELEVPTRAFVAG